MAASGWQLKKQRTITGPSPSEFNARLTLEYPSKVPDGGGGFTSTWVVAATIDAIVDEFQSEEMAIAMQSTALTVIKVKIRWRTDLKSNWRVETHQSRNHAFGLKAPCELSFQLPPAHPESNRSNWHRRQ